MGVETLHHIRRDVPLEDFNTYRVGGRAKYFLEVGDAPTLQRAIQTARAGGVPYFILGGGTNLLANDKGFAGLVIKISLQKYAVHGNILRAQAGVPMGTLAQSAKKLSLSGLEWAAGLPGTVGGAVYGNAGSFGGDMGGVIQTVRVYEPDADAMRVYHARDCHFGYRSSVFQSNGCIIMSADIALYEGNRERITEQMEHNMQYRIAHQPLGGQSEGCVFKNTEIAFSPQVRALIARHPAFFHFARAQFLPAGFLIEQAGLKNTRVGGAHVSETHGNFIVNDGSATTRDIFTLITLIKEKVFQKYNVVLEQEIQILKNF